MKERLALQARYNGMRNRAMRDKLERGECVDLAGCKLGGDPRNPHLVVPPDVWQEDVDYCIAGSEAWIWSIGRELATGEIHAAVDTRFYMNDRYECLWLR